MIHPDGGVGVGSAAGAADPSAAVTAATIAATSSGDAPASMTRSAGRASAHRGTFPCLRAGRRSFFVRSIVSASMSSRRVSRGSMTSST